MLNLRVLQNIQSITHWVVAVGVRVLVKLVRGEGGGERVEEGRMR